MHNYIENSGLRLPIVILYLFILYVLVHNRHVIARILARTRLRGYLAGLPLKDSDHLTFLLSDQCSICLIVIPILNLEMAKRKVIEDSDDEENGEPTPSRPSATGLSDITLSTIVSLDGSASREIQEQSADPSTSSTGLY